MKFRPFVKFLLIFVVQSALGQTLHFKFDDGYTTVLNDSTGSGSTGSLPAGPITRVTSGLRIAGINSSGQQWVGQPIPFVSNTNYSVFPKSNEPFTISVWLRPSSLAVNQWYAIATNEVPGISGFRMLLYGNPDGSSKLGFWTVQSGGTLSISSTTNLSPGKWYHVAVTYNGQIGTIYVDGVPESASFGTVKGNSETIKIAGGIGGINLFKGTIDEFRIYRSEMSQGAIERSHIQDALCIHFQLNEPSGPTLSDSSGTGRTGTLQSNPSLSRTPAGHTRNAIIGNGGIWDNTKGVIAANNFGFPSTNQPFTISAWVKPTDLANGQMYTIATNENYNAYGFRFVVIKHSNFLQVGFWSTQSGGSVYVVSTQQSLINNSWHHIAATFDGVLATLLIDGIVEATSTGNIIGSPYYLKFGGGIGGVNSFRGTIDNIQVHSVALSSNSIRTLIEGSKSTLHLEFDNVVSGVTPDSSGNGNIAAFPINQGSTRTIDGFAGSGANFTGIPWSGQASIAVSNTINQVLPPSNNQFTIELKIKPESLVIGQAYAIATNEIHLGSGFRMLVTRHANRVNQIGFWSTQSGGSVYLVSKSNLTEYTWHDVAVTYDGMVARLYINGRLESESSGVILGNTQPLRIGSGIGGISFFKGQIDNFQVFSTARSEAQLAESSNRLEYSDILITTSVNTPIDIRLARLQTGASLAIVGPPTHGTYITLPSDGSLIRYTPGSGIRELDSVSFTINDGFGNAREFTAYISVVKDYFIAKGIPNGALGTSENNPMLVNTAPELQAFYDSCQEFSRFFYAPGVYELSGAEITIRNGWKHVGAGAVGASGGGTTFRMVDDDDILISRAGPIYRRAILQAGGVPASNVGISGIELDCNAMNLSTFNNYQKTSSYDTDGSFGAIFLRGNNIWIHDCSVRGFGTKDGEVFAIFLNSYYQEGLWEGTLVDGVKIAYNNFVDNVSFSQPALGNLQGLTCLAGGATGQADDGTRIVPVNFRARNISVFDVVSDFYYSNGVSFPNVKDSYFCGVESGAYAEPGSGPGGDFHYGTLIENCVFENVLYGVHVRFLNPQNGSPPEPSFLGDVDSYIIRNNRFLLPQGGWAVTISGNRPDSDMNASLIRPSQDRINYLEISHNEIAFEPPEESYEYSYFVNNEVLRELWSLRYVYLGGIFLHRANARVFNNKIALRSLYADPPFGVVRDIYYWASYPDNFVSFLEVRDNTNHLGNPVNVTDENGTLVFTTFP